MKLYVTRHGQTAWNRENRVCGKTDLPLTELGVAQAQATADRLRDCPIDRIFCSPLLRAQQTAQIINQGRNLPMETDPRIAEQNYGRFEGVPSDSEAFQRHKRMFATHYPGGESHMRTAQRVYNFLDDIQTVYPGQSLLLVCHGGICRIIETYFHDLSNEAFFQFAMENCQVRTYEL